MKLSDLKGKSAEEVASLLGVEGRKLLLERLTTLGMPDKKSEEYRYFNVEALLEREYARLEYIPRHIEESDHIEIVDGVVTRAPKGLRIYYESSDAIDPEHFDPIYYLNHLLSPVIIRIDLDGDSEVELLHRFTQSDTLINYRIRLFNQSNRHATLYERFESEEISGSLVLYGYDMHIAPDSTLRIIKTQSMDQERYAMIASHHIHIEKNANAIFKSFDLGGDQSLQLLKVDLESHAHIEAGHLLYLNHNAKRGTVSKIIHKGEHATSNQEAKNILDGKARGIFDALIKVEHSAKWTKAHQNSKAILLHEAAHMAAKPQLEIYIDELEASHGATTGQLDPKQLFYLQSRGISYVEARKMLVIAFANTLIETVKDTRHQERIREAFEAAFYAGHNAIKGQ